MYFRALAVDYDGTLATKGKVKASTIEALNKLKESGRKLIMVTGRQIDELKAIFDRLDLFDRVVAENGALIYTPQTESQHQLAEPPPDDFIEQLKSSGVSPILIGKVIVATVEPQEAAVLEVIRDKGLALDIIFNKGAVMVLPSGVNKATGLAVALKEMGLSVHNVVGIGDAENDHVFLRAVGLGVAVANANEAVLQKVDFVTNESNGRGVEELIGKLLDDEETLVSKVRNKITIGLDNQDKPALLNHSDRVLIAGSSGIGKSTLATALTEKMTGGRFQFCIFDPEGDYQTLENAIGVGETKVSPSQKQVIDLLQDPTCNVVVNTLGVELKERPSFFAELAPKLLSLKASTGRPHWLIIDEAHHLMPAAQDSISVPLPKEGIILITVHPEAIAADVLKNLNIIIILGPEALNILEKVSQIIGEPLPNYSKGPPSDNEVLVWQRLPVNILKAIKADKPKQQHKRHTRKYAEGDLDAEFSFYFKGPKNALNLRAQNLMIFLQMAEGIDDETWMHHLKNKDYSEWFKVHIKDDKLANAAAQIESDSSLSPKKSREAISNLVRELYTGPASGKD